MKRAHPFYSSAEWRKKRREILARDNYECTVCDADVSAPGAARVDHIVTIAKAWHRRLDDDNLRTLCIRCDNQRHSEKGRGSPVFGCGPDGRPADPAHWWNR